jgi:hypothetical protein
MTEEDDALWRKRFQVFALVRLFGVAIFMLGIVIAYSDWLRPGGWPLVGLVVAVAGGIDAVFAPRLLKRLWAQQDSERPQ